MPQNFPFFAAPYQKPCMVTARKRGQPANQRGDWWIGGAEDRPSKSVRAGQIQGDAPKGTLLHTLGLLVDISLS